MEPRRVLSAAPTLAAISNVTLAAGAPMCIALDGYDADGDNLSFTISVSNQNITGGTLGYTVTDGNRSMLISTNYGDMIFELFEDMAPETTARIIELAQSGFYDDLLFHRITAYDSGLPFVIQGGDPDGDGSGGSGVDFDDEFNPLLMHTTAGVLSMAKSYDDTNDSQFFITGSSARHLDFNHSVFGFQVEGQSVRQTIEQVAVDANDKPLTNVIMESVEIFYDNENGVLILAAPEGATGSADVTVTVSDGNGGTSYRTFHVTVAADTDASANSAPYLGNLPDVQTTADTPVSFYLSSIDVEGDAVYYAGLVYSDTDDIDISVNSTTGLVTVTPSNGITGVYELYFGVRATNGSSWDTQFVPLLINPAAPTGIDLVSSSDTGASSSDNITNLDNSSGEAMTFSISGTLSGAIVSLYADGELIGQATAAGTTTLVTTNGTLDLSDGSHAFTARQTLAGVDLEVGNRDETVNLVSALSTALSVKVDTAAPQFTSTAPTAATEGILYQYQAAAVDSAGGIVFSLENGPAGMTVSSTGLVSWTPNSSHSPSEQVVLAATDAAGNKTQQTYTIQIAQGPNVVPVPDQTVAEGGVVAFTVSASPYGDDGPLTFSLNADAPSGATIDAVTGEFTWTTLESHGPGQYSVNILVAAPSGANHVETVVITVSEVNLPPVLAAIGDAATAEGQLVDFTATATDADLPANNLTYSLVGDVPAGAKIDPASGRFTWRPDESQGGQTFAFTVRVSDAGGAYDEQSFSVSVAEIDSAPQFAAFENQTIAAGQTLRVLLAATDPDLPAKAIVYSIESGAPAGLTIDAATGLLTWAVPQEQPTGTFDVVIRAAESAGGEAVGLHTTVTLHITVIQASSFWLVLDQLLSGDRSPENLNSPAAGAAADALFANTSDPAATGSPLALLPPTLFADTSGGEDRPLGFQIASDGSGGEPLPPVEMQEGRKDVKKKKPAAEQADAGIPDQRAMNLPAAANVETPPSEAADSGMEEIEPSPPQTAQAVDAVMAESAEGGVDDAPAAPEET